METARFDNRQHRGARDAASLHVGQMSLKAVVTVNQSLAVCMFR